MSAQAEFETKGSEHTEMVLPQWNTYEHRHVYKVDIAVTRGEDFALVAFVPLLPGVYGQGESIPEVINDIRDSFVESIRAYQSMGVEIPWLESPEEVPNDALRIRVTVDVSDE